MPSGNKRNVLLCYGTEQCISVGTSHSYYTDATGTSTNQSRYVQQWLSLLQHAYINDAMFRAELTKTTANNKWLIGTEDIFHYLNPAT